MSAALPDIMASVLRSAGCSHPVSFAVSINNNGAVTLTAQPHTPSSAYAPFFEALTRKLNQSFPVGDNHFLEFRTAPIFTDLLIHNLPLSMLPPDPPALLERLQESILNATDATIISARFLQKDQALRESKTTTSVVVSVLPQDLHLLGPNLSREGSKIRLFNRLREVRLAHPASRDTQCKKCYRFGHSLPLCKATHFTCPICAKPHPRREHRCANDSCPQQGNVRIVAGCCTATRSRCVNCDDEHPATTPSCPVRVAIRDAARPPRDHNLPDAPPSVHPTPPPRTPTQQALPRVPSAPPATARHVPPLRTLFSATSSAGVFANPGDRAPLSLATPLPTRALFSPHGPPADWSEEPNTDSMEDL